MEGDGSTPSRSSAPGLRRVKTGLPSQECEWLIIVRTGMWVLSPGKHRIHSLNTEPSVQARLRRRDWIKTGTGLTVVAALEMPASGGAGATEMTTETRDQGMPAFYAQAPSLTLRDPLAQFLGAAQNGVMEYRYANDYQQFACLGWRSGFDGAQSFDGLSLWHGALTFD